nr:Collagen alpha-1(XIX) chain like [Ipomoea batatas]
MAEEFLESEIVFPESVNDNGYAVDDEERSFSGDSRESRSKKQRRRTIKTSAAAERRETNSLPVNIPVESWFRCVDVEAELFGEEEEEMVPPHVITGRRIARKMMSFSVCTGYGRTLKGRDLSEVRNSILRMTGFLEA